MNWSSLTLAKKIEPWRPLPEFKYVDFMGWHRQGHGKLFLGINIEQGRVKDEGDFRLKTLLRKIVDTYKLDMVVCPNQSIIFKDIEPSDKVAIDALMAEHGVKTIEQTDPLVREAMACPALPMCGLAITEAERIMPKTLERVRAVLNKVGLGSQEIIIRMTGCPNGCARPYMGELAFVGDGPDTYQVWMGGSRGLTRTGFAVTERMKIAELENYLEVLFTHYRDNRLEGEAFGDFCAREGKDKLCSVLPGTPNSK